MFIKICSSSAWLDSLVTLPDSTEAKCNCATDAVNGMRVKMIRVTPGLIHKTLHMSFLSTNLIEMSMEILEIMNRKWQNHMTKGAWVPELPCIRQLTSKQGNLLGGLSWIRNKLLCKPADILGFVLYNNCLNVILYNAYGKDQDRRNLTEEESQDKKQVQQSMRMMHKWESTKHMYRVSGSLTALLDSCID